MPQRYATVRVASIGGATAHVCYPAERAGDFAWLRGFAAKAPAPPPAGIVELDDVILGNGRDCACLYDRDGRRIDPSALVRYDEDFVPQVWRAAPTLANTKTALTIAEPVLYGSIFFNHWGHFLLESAARFWAKTELGALPLVMPWLSARRAPAIDAFLASAGLAVVGADVGRIRLAKCFLATPAFAHEGYAEPRHLWVPHEIARRVPTCAVRDDRPVYLSRTRVEAPVAGRRRVRNEAELEARLAERGALVVHMQELPLAEQIALVNTHRTFIGLWGSALHNTLFSLEGSEISTFTLIDDGRRPVNFLLVDSLVGADAHYLNTVHDPGDGALVIDVEATIAYLRDCGVIR